MFWTLLTPTGHRGAEIPHCTGLVVYPVCYRLAGSTEGRQRPPTQIQNDSGLSQGLSALASTGAWRPDKGVELEIINNGLIQRVAARLSLGLSVVFLALLATLHVLEPEFNSGHLISEYQLGDYGFLMSLAFCLLGVSALLLAVSLRPRLHTRGERVGWWWLLIIGAAFFVAGVFPPVQIPLIIGYLHGISGLVSIFGSPIAFTLIGRSLASNEPEFLLSHRMRWATLAVWGGLGLFLASLNSLAKRTRRCRRG
jgi:hypothetical protein